MSHDSWFDPRISLGTILANAVTLLVLLTAFIKAHIANKERMADMKTKVDAMWLVFVDRLKGGGSNGEDADRDSKSPGT